ncbi:protein-L-isoaspartate O-methyltransferase [Plastorhodobacter daqingensis]|uniref:Protein-L-isoaspartate O-methyltransferase n=1 Tax=Plastorhodobacter daqingensis TaxID=1387281 RepID=A0ABW2URI8_9RHOB
MPDYAARRSKMVDHQIRPSDVTKFPIIDAMLTVPRELFVPDSKREMAYMGENLVYGLGRYLLEPRTFAKMLEVIDLQPSDLVLDIGCGLGYSTAVIARLAEAVVAIEEDEPLAAEAQAILSDQGVYSAAVVTAPLTEGAPQHGPYDAIIVEGAIEVFPDALAAQLKEGGRAVCLFMEDVLGVCRVGFKFDGKITWRDAFNASAPVLPGFEKHRSFTF